MKAVDAERIIAAFAEGSFCETIALVARRLLQKGFALLQSPKSVPP